MSTVTMNPDKMTAPVIAIYDLMLDGDWHPNGDLINHGVTICAQSETEAALSNGRRVRKVSIESGKAFTDPELIEAGAKDLVRNRLMIAVRGGRLERTKTHHRMTTAAQQAWQQARTGTETTASARTGPKAHKPAKVASRSSATVAAPVLTIATTAATQTVPTDATDGVTVTTVTKNGKATRTYTTPTTFGDITEADGWAQAPLEVKDRVHFRIDNDTLPLAAFRAMLPATTSVTYDEGTGLYRVDVTDGAGEAARTLILDWCAEHGFDTKGLRIEKGMRRRIVNDLNPYFLSDLCAFYATYCRGPLRKHKSTLQFHFKEQADENQQVFEWILEGIACYDETSGVPFGAFLTKKLPGWVHNLNRQKYGRNLSDAEMRQQRAVQDFTSEFGRKPTERELAECMGQDIATFRKTSGMVSNVQAIRNAGTIDVTAHGDSEVPLPSGESVEDRYEAAMRQSLVSQVMTKACGVDEDARGKLSKVPNVLGWVAWYQTAWLGKNKVTMANELQTSTRNMSQYSDRAQQRMIQFAGDLLDG